MSEPRPKQATLNARRDLLPEEHMLSLLRETPVERAIRERCDGAPPPLALAVAEEEEPPKEVEGFGEGRATSYASCSSSTSYATAGKLSRADLLEFDKREDFARAVAGLAGLPDVPGVRGQWVVGTDTLSVELWQDKRGRFVYLIRDGWPVKPARRSLALVEVYAAALTGELLVTDPGGERRSRRGSGLARIKSKLLLELGFVAGDRVALPPLAPDAPAAAVETWDVLSRLLAVRWLTEDQSEPFAFSAPWIAKHFAAEQNVIRAGKYWLEKHGYLCRAGTAPGRIGRDTILWLATPVVAPSEQVRP